MADTTPHGVADPQLVGARMLQAHRWYSTWFGAFGVANLVMVVLVDVLSTPWSWIAPIAIGVAGLVAVFAWLPRHRSVVAMHRKTSAVFFIGLVVIWAITCPLALMGQGRPWVFWVGGVLMLVLGLITAARIRSRAEQEINSDFRMPGSAAN